MKFSTTISALKSSPFWNLTPCRRWNVQTVASSLRSQLSARPPWGFRSHPRRSAVPMHPGACGRNRHPPDQGPEYGHQPKRSYRLRCDRRMRVPRWGRGQLRGSLGWRGCRRPPETGQVPRSAAQQSGVFQIHRILLLSVQLISGNAQVLRMQKMCRFHGRLPESDPIRGKKQTIKGPLRTNSVSGFPAEITCPICVERP